MHHGSFALCPYCLVTHYFTNGYIDRINARETCILCHNIGINSESKWNSVKNNILETKADIVCLQETKRDVFYLNYLRKLCPRNFDDFAHVPSIGNSRGTLITWKVSRPKISNFGM
jgi:exonuclease III